MIALILRRSVLYKTRARDAEIASCCDNCTDSSDRVFRDSTERDRQTDRATETWQMATQSGCITYEIGEQMRAPGAFNTFVFGAGVTQQVCWLLHPALPSCPRSFCSGKGEGRGQGGFGACAMAGAQAPAASRSSVLVLPPAQRRVWAARAGMGGQELQGLRCFYLEATAHPSPPSRSGLNKQPDETAAKGRADLLEMVK